MLLTRSPFASYFCTPARNSCYFRALHVSVKNAETTIKIGRHNDTVGNIGNTCSCPHNAQQQPTLPSSGASRDFLDGGGGSNPGIFEFALIENPKGALTLRSIRKSPRGPAPQRRAWPSHTISLHAISHPPPLYYPLLIHAGKRLAQSTSSRLNATGTLGAPYTSALHPSLSLCHCRACQPHTLCERTLTGTLREKNGASRYEIAALLQQHQQRNGGIDRISPCTCVCADVSARCRRDRPLSML